MKWNFESDLGNIKPGLPFALQLTNDAKFVEINGLLPQGLFLYQSGRLMGMADWSTNLQSYQFDLRAVNDDQFIDRTFILSVNNLLPHAFLVVLTSGYESAKNQPWTP